jgi:O-antigen/teichoic acid export membrane protein
LSSLSEALNNDELLQYYSGFGESHGIDKIFCRYDPGVRVLSKLELGRGAAYIYIELISALFSAYIFWIIISKFTSTEVIGTSSAVVSFATIFSTIVTLGLPSGIQRFLGKSFSMQMLGESKALVIISFIVIFFAMAVCTVFLLSAKNIIHYNFNFELTVVSLLLIGSSAISTLLR